MTTFNPAIAVVDADIPVWATMPLQSVLAADDGIDADACIAALGHGETWMEGGGAAPVTILVNLDHRDTPMHFPSRAVADLAYAAFCFHRGLEHVDAQENLARVAGEPFFTPFSVSNWLSAFVDHYDDLEA